MIHLGNQIPKIMKFYCSFLLFISCFSLFSQGEANNWYFGNYAGLSFNTTPPTALTDGKINTLEGCTSISDASGKLLFYTDGITVWNRSHAVMLNGDGLKGDKSSTTSGLIVPQPNTIDKYIIFTVDEPSHLNPTNDGFMYSIVDMTLDGGNGAIISGKKNIQLVTYNASDPIESKYKCSEKITAVKSDDCDSFWVITHFVNKFYAFEVDATGVKSTPVISTVGVTVPLSGYRRNALGYIKTSTKGDKLAVAHLGLTNITGGDGPGKVLLYNFDNTTGIVSNEIELYNGDAPYGIEFSQNGQRLYTSVGIGDTGYGGGGFILQYDLSLPDSQIPSSGKRILNENGVDNFAFQAGALQIGPDGKIYQALHSPLTTNGDYLGVIENPEEIASKVIYKEKGILVNIDGSRSSQMGLPPFIQSIFAKTIDIINNGTVNEVNLNLCKGETYRLSYENIPIATYTWYVDNILSTNKTHYLDISSKGNYRLEIDLNDGSCPLKGVANVSLFAPPTGNPSTLIQCDADQNSFDGLTIFNLKQAEIQLTGGLPNLSVSFFADIASATAGNPIIGNPNIFENTIANQKIYVRVTDNNTTCFGITTLDLSTSNTTANDATLTECEDDGTEDGIKEFDLSIANSQILKGLNSSDYTIYYYVTLENALSETNPIKKHTNTTPYTNGQDIIYARVEDNLNNCYGINKVQLILNHLPDIKDNDNFYLCKNQNYTKLSAGILPNDNPNGYTYLWSTNETTETIQVNQTGTYSIVVTNTLTGCSKKRTIEVLASEPATIKSITINDLSDNNTVTIIAEGIGNYEFALEINQNLSSYQDSPTFSDVPPGLHRVFVKDKNGCLPLTFKDITIIGFPKYFTPNGDGIHETWNLEGISDETLLNSKIYIFDRSGKLLKQIAPNRIGWNGKYQGQLMPSSQYWYRLELTDGRVLTGKFSLIR